jgi:ligand-binding sensor domain-containing protein
LWASITLGKKCIAVKKTNNTWTLLDFEQFVVNPTVSKIIFDKQDQAWIVLPRNLGLMVYKDVNGLSQPNSSNTKLLSISEGNGHLPSVDVHSICEDKGGHIWVGTAKGVAVFYNPENVFTGANWDSQQILIEQDGHVQILLENDIITAIAVDGVNRKWIGTESSGVYCFSSDGQEEIYHFTAESSPIYSNLIKDIVTDETSGDIFIATDKGIQTFRTPIIKGFDEYTDVHAYPNPIRPGTSTPVYITGLVDESDVKITDVSGNLIWSTKSQGGQVVWNLQSFAGTKAASGVYMIYCSTANGDKSATAKLLIVN